MMVAPILQLSDSKQVSQARRFRFTLARMTATKSLCQTASFISMDLPVVAAAGDGRIAGGPAGIDDIFVGSKFNGSDEFALVIGGRDVWPGVDAPLVVSTAGNDPALGVTVLEVPDGQKTGYSASVVGDLNDDGFDTIALSAGNPTAVYMFDGQEVLPDTLEYGDGTNPAVRALPTQSCLGEDGAGATIVGGADLDGEGTADVIV